MDGTRLSSSKVKLPDQLANTLQAAGPSSRAALCRGWSCALERPWQGSGSRAALRENARGIPGHRWGSLRISLHRIAPPVEMPVLISVPTSDRGQLRRGSARSWESPMAGRTHRRFSGRRAGRDPTASGGSRRCCSAPRRAHGPPRRGRGRRRDPSVRGGPAG